MPIFYHNFVPKINALSQKTFGAGAKKTNFSATGYTIGWCIIVAPLVFVLSAILLDGMLGMINFNLDFTSFGDLFVSMITYVSGIIPSVTYMETLIGCIAIWLIAVFVMGAYYWRKTCELYDQIGSLVRYYELDVRESALIGSGWSRMEKFNIDAGKYLIERKW